MRGLKPIPLRLLAYDAVVRVPDGAGGFAAGVVVGRVGLALVQSAVNDAHRSADAGAGTVYIDAVNSTGAFEVPAGSRVDIDRRSLYVTACRRCEGMGGRVHHWELTVR